MSNADHSTAPGSHYASGALYAAALLLAIYFGCPPLLIWPLVKTYGSYSSVPPGVSQGVKVAFTPVRLLAQAAPKYLELIVMEEKLLGLAR